MNLPENYVVICDTEKETNEVVNFIEPTNNRIWSFWKYVTISNNVWSIHGSEESVIQWFNKKHNISDYKTFTFKEWKEMKENKTMQKLTISVTELLEIHIIACLSWKSKIAQYLIRVDENQNVTFTQQEVDEMFEAVTGTQKPTLIRIFGEKEIKKISGWFIKSNSKIEEIKDILNDEENKNIWKTKEQAEACLAMSELSHLIYEVNKDWIPDYTNNDTKYVINIFDNKIDKNYFSNTQFFLSFKTAEIRDKFLEENRELILKAKPLL